MLDRDECENVQEWFRELIREWKHQCHENGGFPIGEAAGLTAKEQEELEMSIEFPIYECVDGVSYYCESYDDYILVEAM